jgi:hypothetical protein
VRTLIIALALILPCGPLIADEKTDAARKAAEAWLALVDEGKYGESWEQAAALFKDKVTREQWVAAMNGTRKPLGALKSRSLLGSKYMTNLPGAPDGEYVVIQYKTSFENKEGGVETITPALDSDGKWRVSGYFIR